MRKAFTVWYRRTLHEEKLKSLEKAWSAALEMAQKENASKKETARA
jgi:hypothetical protein